MNKPKLISRKAEDFRGHSDLESGWHGGFTEENQVRKIQCSQIEDGLGIYKAFSVLFYFFIYLFIFLRGWRIMDNC